MRLAKDTRVSQLLGRGKACGAGGGGCIVLLTPAELRETVAAALEDLGARRLRARPAAGPLVLEQIG